ncbi:MAG: SGNH/GDSL hydrolase family protein, partial [Candidatus Dadabacteria bacterium]
MKREYIIIIGATLISLAVSIIILRAIEPRLFKLPADMQVVKLDRKIPPFYENVFRASDLKAKNFQLNDPVTVVRNKPLFPELPGLGPHDLLGFRNRYIPNHADVVTIGDSQTYGNNALMIESWPAVLEKNLAGRHAKVYSMAAGGWAAPQYLSMLRYAYAFTPQVIVIAFYTGNDALETFRTVYANDYWKSFRSDPKASLTDLPKIKLPLPDSEILRVKLDSNEIAFTPRRRLLSNNRSLIAVNTGFKIIERILTEIDKIAKVQSA